ncbi:hypothetical protein TSUD_16540 [Trifolium subterraneum]|uniref:Cytochrome P450 n=1 Tax=Trifolium subterraneum TaxID=3900 RepID=A0A2Z6M283_TRISU|nr:hypothetical protein TSUD_16540 [Trifolium subterraneum]
MIPSVLHNLSNIHDFVTLGLKHHGGTSEFKGPWFTNIANFIITSDPMNVHHITSKNFTNYGKGSDFHEIFFEVLGLAISNLDSNEWKQERTLLHSLLKRKSFETSLQQNIQKKLENCLLPFLEHQASKSVQVLDLEDILERHYIPKHLWKLQKWLQIGQEKKNKVALENLNKFLFNCIIYSKGVEEKRRLRSGENVDESHSLGLLKALIKEGSRKEEMVENEKYIRDTALNLLVAGNGTITSGLSWFFRLVSTHPNVEAKIIEEIKDNFPTQEDNLINNLNVEKLDKLVYLHGVICEALRLYPPIPFEHKCSIKSDILPSGVRVKPNTKLIYSLYAMGRMEQIWGEDCLEFKPERWISNTGKIKHVPSYKFIAFNAGPRSCLGKDISFVQMKMVAAAVLWKFHIQVVEGQSITPRISMVLRMEGLKVNVSKRSI